MNKLCMKRDWFKIISCIDWRESKDNQLCGSIDSFKQAIAAIAQHPHIGCPGAQRFAMRQIGEKPCASNEAEGPGNGFSPE